MTRCGPGRSTAGTRTIGTLAPGIVDPSATVPGGAMATRSIALITR